MEAFASQYPTAETDEGAENLPSERGMERMNNNYDAQLWQIIEKQKLGALSQFHQQGFWDEVPLYSRKSDVDFLPDDERADGILLRFALKFLKSVIAYEQHPRGYFAAITAWHFSDDPVDERLVPHLFAWCCPIGELEEKLVLRQVNTAFAKRLRKLVSKLRLTDQFSVLEDTQTELGGSHVFIAPTLKPYRGFVTLDHFCSRALSSK